MRKNEELGSLPIGKLLANLAIPAIAAQLINLLYNLVDRIYIGHIPGIGNLALTGVGVCLPLITLISAFAALTSMGGAPRASISMGKGDMDEAEEIMGNCTTLLVITALCLTALFLLFCRPLLLSFGASENTIIYGVSYMRIYSIGTIFVQLTLGLNAFISAQGFAKTSMVTVIIGAVLNIILDPLFIFVFHMGVQGAAIATVISQAVSCIWTVQFLTKGKTILHLKKAKLHLQKKVILPCVFLGLSPFIMQSTESLLMVAFNASLLKYGGDMAVGAMTIISSLSMFVNLPLHGLTQGAQPIVSYNYGAGNKERVKKGFLLLLLTCTAYSSLFWLIIQLFPRPLITLFTTDASLIAATMHAGRIYFAVCFLLGIQIACQQTFIAIGNAKSSLFLALLRKIILLIPLIYILPHFFAVKTDAVFLAEPVADSIAVATTATLFAIQFRKVLKSMDKDE